MQRKHCDLCDEIILDNTPCLALQPGRAVGSVFYGLNSDDEREYCRECVEQRPDRIIATIVEDWPLREVPSLTIAELMTDLAQDAMNKLAE